MYSGTGKALRQSSELDRFADGIAIDTPLFHFLLSNGHFVETYPLACANYPNVDAANAIEMEIMKQELSRTSGKVSGEQQSMATHVDDYMLSRLADAYERIAIGNRRFCQNPSDAAAQAQAFQDMVRERAALFVKNRSTEATASVGR